MTDQIEKLQTEVREISYSLVKTQKALETTLHKYNMLTTVVLKKLEKDSVSSLDEMVRCINEELVLQKIEKK